MIYLLLFMLIPILEIAAFIQVGSLVGLIPTLLLCLFTAVLGAGLIRIQGIQALAQAQENLQKGVMPLQEIVDGICLLVAGILLLTPGFLTDTIGFLLLVPFLRVLLRYRVTELVKSGRFNFSRGGGTSGTRSSASWHYQTKIYTHKSGKGQETPSKTSMSSQDKLQDDIIDVEYEDVPREK